MESARRRGRPLLGNSSSLISSMNVLVNAGKLEVDRSGIGHVDCRGHRAYLHLAQKCVYFDSEEDENVTHFCHSILTPIRINHVTDRIILLRAMRRLPYDSHCHSIIGRR